MLSPRVATPELHAAWALVGLFASLRGLEVKLKTDIGLGRGEFGRLRQGPLARGSGVGAMGLEAVASGRIVTCECAGGGGLPVVAFGEAVGSGAVAVFERGFEVGVVSGDDGPLGGGGDVAALELGLTGGVLARRGPVAVLEGLLGRIDLWTTGLMLASRPVKCLCVAAVAAVASGLGDVVGDGRLTVGGHDLAAGVAELVGLDRVLLEGGPQPVGVLA